MKLNQRFCNTKPPSENKCFFNKSQFMITIGQVTPTPVMHKTLSVRSNLVTNLYKYKAKIMLHCKKTKNNVNNKAFLITFYNIRTTTCYVCK